MKPTAYVETSVVSYLTARPSRDVVIAGHQQVTHDWWKTCRDRFTLVASEIVRKEAMAGDVSAAHERAQILSLLTILEVVPKAKSLARKLIKSGILPAKAADDAFHIAIAAVHQVDYLVTWNCKHIANAAARPMIEKVCKRKGRKPLIICTPEELLGELP